jgi:hypothetical protein
LGKYDKNGDKQGMMGYPIVRSCQINPFFFASGGPLAHLGTPQRPGKIAGFQRHLAPRGKDELETTIMGFHQQKVVSNYQQKLGMLCFLLT